MAADGFIPHKGTNPYTGLPSDEEQEAAQLIRLVSCPTSTSQLQWNGDSWNVEIQLGLR